MSIKKGEKIIITKEMLTEVGMSIARGWGGELIGFEINKSENETEVIFDCIEYGEKFYTSLTLKEAYEEYKDITGKN